MCDEPSILVTQAMRTHLSLTGDWVSLRNLHQACKASRMHGNPHYLQNFLKDELQMYTPWDIPPPINESFRVKTERQRQKLENQQYAQMVANITSPAVENMSADIRQVMAHTSSVTSILFGVITGFITGYMLANFFTGDVMLSSLCGLLGFILSLLIEGFYFMKSTTQETNVALSKKRR